MAYDFLSAAREALDRFGINTGVNAAINPDTINIASNAGGKSHAAYTKSLLDKTSLEKALADLQAANAAYAAPAAPAAPVAAAAAKPVAVDNTKAINDYRNQLNTVYDNVEKINPWFNKSRNLYMETALATRFPDLNRWKNVYKIMGLPSSMIDNSANAAYSLLTGGTPESAQHEYSSGSLKSFYPERDSKDPSQTMFRDLIL